MIGEILAFIGGETTWMSGCYLTWRLFKLRDNRIRDVEYIMNMPVPPEAMAPDQITVREKIVPLPQSEKWSIYASATPTEEIPTNPNIACDKHLQFDCIECSQKDTGVLYGAWGYPMR